MAAHLEITLKYKDGVFGADVDDRAKKVQRQEHIRWRVKQPEPPEFPKAFVVSVDFPPLRDPLAGGSNGHHKGKRESNGDHHISDNVGHATNGRYPYVISYVDDKGAIHPMKDPELVVEGGPNVPPEFPPPPPPQGGAAAVVQDDTTPPTQKAKKKPAKKKKVKKAGKKKAKKAKTARKAKKSKKAKKAKKAKRSTKRKAKKR